MSVVAQHVTVVRALGVHCPQGRGPGEGRGDASGGIYTPFAGGLAGMFRDMRFWFALRVLLGKGMGWGWLGPLNILLLGNLLL